MDKASVIGSIIGVAVCIGTGWLIVNHGGSWGMFWSTKGIVMVFGGTLSVVFMAMPMDRLKQVPGYVKRFMSNRQMTMMQTYDLMVRFSDKARREGFLALEEDIERIDDEFLQQGMTMAIDGSDAHVIESTLRLQIMSMQERHKAGKKFFDLIKLYGPGYGLAATLIGQIGMFGSLGTGGVDELGAMLAVAVTATLYGTLLANAFAGPVGDKLALRSAEEMNSKEMMLQGVLSIQAGDRPSETQDKMLAFVPKQQRLKLSAAA